MLSTWDNAHQKPEPFFRLKVFLNIIWLLRMVNLILICVDFVCLFDVLDVVRHLKVYFKWLNWTNSMFSVLENGGTSGKLLHNTSSKHHPFGNVSQC